MVNIGEISKPSVSESPVKPRRSQSDSELATAADNIGSTVKVSTQIYPKNQKSNKKSANKKSKQENDDELKASELESDVSSDVDADSEINIDDISYDETGHVTHHGNIDIKA